MLDASTGKWVDSNGNEIVFPEFYTGGSTTLPLDATSDTCVANFGKFEITGKMIRSS